MHLLIIIGAGFLGLRLAQGELPVLRAAAPTESPWP
jgi:hypothetical protein